MKIAVILIGLLLLTALIFTGCGKQEIPVQNNQQQPTTTAQDNIHDSAQQVDQVATNEVNIGEMV